MNGVVTHCEPRLIVGRWWNTYLVPADHPDPASLQQRLDHEFQGNVAEASTQAVASRLDPADPSVWRIRGLDLTFAIADQGSEEVLARIGSQQLASRLAELIARPESSDSVLHFPNRAAFLAQFIGDLASGSAWGKWYYEEFDSLNALPVSAAIREAFSREPEFAAATVGYLAASHQLEATLAVLTDHDVARIYDACSPKETTPSAVPAEWIEPLLTMLSEITATRPAHDSASPRDALRLFVRLCDRFPEFETDPRLRTAIDGSLELSQMLSSVRSSSTSNVIPGHLAAGDFSSVITILQQQRLMNPDAGLDLLRQVLPVKTPDTPVSLASLLSKIVQTPPRDFAAFTSQFVSSFGGIFLLGPSFLELDVDSIAATLARNSDEPDYAAALFRHAIAIQCLGRTRAAQSAGDEALRLFTGFDGAIRADEFATPDAATAAFESVQLLLAENLVTRQRCDDPCLLVETMPYPFSAGEILLVRDIRSNEWIHAAFLPDRVDAFKGVVEHAIESLSCVIGKPDLLLLRGALADRENEFKNLAGQVFTADFGSTSWPDELINYPGVTPENLSRALATVESEFKALSLADVWPDAAMPAFKDLTGILVARAVLKNFARRLMGFASSSPEYLFQNFLAGVTTIRCAPEKIEVQLPPAPLSLILRVSGMSGQSYRLPWLNEKEVCLLSPIE